MSAIVNDFRAKVRDTQPITQSYALGFAFGEINSAIIRLRNGSPADAERALHSALDMIGKACPALNSGRVLRPYNGDVS